jgi:hypothetical protein
MLRRLVINALYDWAKVITYVADALAPPCDNVWRDRQRCLLRQRNYQQFIPAHNCHESHAARPLP